MCYWYTVIKFVCSLSTVSNTDTRSPKSELLVYHHPICLLWQYHRKEIFVKFEKNATPQLYFSILYIEIESLCTSRYI